MHYYRLFVQKYHRYLFFGFILTFCSCLGQMFFISLFGGHFCQEIGLSYGELGWIYSLTTLGSGFLLLWFAPKIEHYKVSYFTLLVLAILIASMFLLSQVKSWMAFFMVLLSLRFFSQSMLGHIAMTTIAKIFPYHRGKAVGIISMGFSLGEALLPLIIVTLTNFLSWQQIWKVLAGFLAVIVVPSLFFLFKRIDLEGNIKHAPLLPNTMIISPGDNSRLWTRSEVLKDKKFYLLLPALLSPTLILTGIFFSHIPLGAEKNWDLNWLAASFSIFALSNLFSCLYFGKKIDEKGCFFIMPYVLPLLSLGLFSLVFISDPIFSVMLYMFCAGMAVGGNRVVLNTIWVELYGMERLGEIRGMVVFICIVCASISPSLFGHLLDRGVAMQSILAASCVYVMLSMLALKWVKWH